MTHLLCFSLIYFYLCCSGGPCGQIGVWEFARQERRPNAGPSTHVRGALGQEGEWCMQLLSVVVFVTDGHTPALDTIGRTQVRHSLCNIVLVPLAHKFRC